MEETRCIYSHSQEMEVLGILKITILQQLPKTKQRNPLIKNDALCIQTFLQTRKYRSTRVVYDSAVKIQTYRRLNIGELNVTARGTKK
jgi:hypothetical protein